MLLNTPLLLEQEKIVHCYVVVESLTVLICFIVSGGKKNQNSGGSLTRTLCVFFCSQEQAKLF